MENFKPTCFYYVLEQKLRKKPTMYFFSMSDPADWKPEWYKKIVEKINQYPQHTFVILTKRPAIYETYCFPINCWLGATVTNIDDIRKNLFELQAMKKVRNLFFLSIEPIKGSIIETDDIKIKEVQEYILFKTIRPDWIIVGPERGKHIPYEWLESFYKFDITVFMKESCKGSLPPGKSLRQEWPEGYLNRKIHKEIKAGNIMAYINT